MLTKRRSLTQEGLCTSSEKILTFAALWFGSSTGSKYNILYNHVHVRYFENFILLMIFVNSVAMALYDYNDRDSLTEHNQIIDKMNLIFTFIYTVEAILKIIAFGFVRHKNSYLREAWNCIDLIVVVFG